ncbi:MAG TPA: hypothetical protein QGF58_12685 [Myxococcota bacterium]|nr:hypothetical protein [Myxococcota bacterium]
MLLLTRASFASTATVSDYDALAAAAGDPSVTEIVILDDIQGAQVAFTGRPVFIYSDGGPFGVPSLSFDDGTDGTVLQDLIFGTDMGGETMTTSHLDVLGGAVTGVDLQMVGDSGLYTLSIRGGSVTLTNLQVTDIVGDYAAAHLNPDNGVDGTLLIDGCSVSNPGPGFLSVAGSGAQETKLELIDCDVSSDDSRAEAVWVYGENVAVDVVGGEYRGHQSAFVLAGPYDITADITATFDGVTFLDNTQGAIIADRITSLEVTNSAFCNNSGNAGGQDVYSVGTKTTYRYNFNHAASDGSAVLIGDDWAIVEQNSFYDNQVALELAGEEVTLVNNLFDDNAQALTVDDGVTFSERGYNAWWANGYAGIDLDDTELSLQQDPGYVSMAEDDCDWRPYLGEGSPLIDAGAPDRVDPDGSRADIGAFPFAAGDDSATVVSWISGGCTSSLAGLCFFPLLLLSRRRCS